MPSTAANFYHLQEVHRIHNTVCGSNRQLHNLSYRLCIHRECLRQFALKYSNILWCLDAMGLSFKIYLLIAWSYVDQCMYRTLCNLYSVLNAGNTNWKLLVEYCDKSRNLISYGFVRSIICGKIFAANQTIVLNL